MSRKPWAMYKDYLISFKLKNLQFRVYDARTHTISTMAKLPDNINKFTMLNVNDNVATDEDLFKYAKEFMQWNKELRFNKICSFRYSECYSDYTAVTRCFNARCDYKDHEPITPTEYKWMEKCANFGIQYLEKEDYTKTGFGYDFKNQYALVLHSDNKIPTKQGKEVTLTELPKRHKLKHGFYHVKISSANNNFRKIFAYSKDHVYLQASLKLAMKHRKKYNVKIELQQHENNAYVYDRKDMVTLKSITDRWFTELTDLRKLYPKNRLLKHLLSSVWGHLNQKNTKNMHLEDMQKLNIGVTMEDEYMIMEYHKYDKEEYWVVMETAKPYKYNIRLKPWVTALARNMTAEIVLQNIKHVHRIHTDGIIFSKEMTFDDPNLVAEDKTTGKIHFVNNNCYHNSTTGYKTKGYDNWVKKHA